MMSDQNIISLLLILSVLILHSSFIDGLDTATCIAPLGMESGAISDSDISASSSFEHASVGPHNGRIRIDKNGGAWCPRNMIGTDANEWLEINLKDVHVITGSETMGRFGNGLGAEFSESYILEYWRDRLGKWVRYRNIENQEVLEGNTNTYLAVKQSIEPVILASKVRFHPYSPHQRTICMRVEIYGCRSDVGLLSYSMPQGDKRGPTYEFYDWNYDGEWRGNYLENGLGSLTDGNLGPDDYKLSYYAKNRGWVGWKSDKREFVEIVFEFEEIREFHGVQLYSNNQFSREIAIFKEIKAFFSISGKIYGKEPVSQTPLSDEIFEEPRNVSIKLHRRVGRFVKIQLFFASKWILVSEVTFDSSTARGNYTEEVSEGDIQHVQQDQQDDKLSPSVPDTVINTSPGKESELSLMPIIVGALTTVIVLLAAIIFFIVSRSRSRKQWTNKPSVECSMPSEKVALNPTEPLHYSYFAEGAISESGSNSGSRSGGSRKVPIFDDNYNNPHPGYGSPRSPRSGFSRQGSCGASPGPRRITPLSTPRMSTPRHTGTPLRRIISNPLSEMPLYMEPYHVMRYSPYVRCGPGDFAISKETAILSDTSCGEYAVPVPTRSPNSASSRVSQSSHNVSGSQTSLDQNSDYVFLQNEGVKLSDSLRLMRMRVENLILYQVDPDSILLKELISDGTFGTVHTGEIRIPSYGQLSPLSTRMVAVKYMNRDSGDQEKKEFMREVRLLAGLEDENISRVLGVCETRTPYFVVMEYLEHGDLTKFLRSHLPETTPFLPPGTRTLSFPTLIYMATQIASGMKYLESLNFVHRDLATRNCLVGKAYHIKICDFGSDTPEYRRDYTELEDGLLVPLRWMAWESVLEKRFTTKSDVWSFGVCMWEILNYSGIRPYHDLTDSQIISKLQSKSCPTLPQPQPCSRDLYELMEECWNLEETLRPSFREIHLFLQRKNLGYSPV